MNMMVRWGAKALIGGLLLAGINVASTIEAGELPEGYEPHWEDLFNNRARHEADLSQFGDIPAEEAIKKYLDTHLYKCNDNMLALLVIRFDKEQNVALAQFKGLEVGGWNADPLDVFASEMGGLPRDQARSLFDNLRMTRAGGNAVIFAADEGEITAESAMNGVRGYASAFPKYEAWRIRLLSPQPTAWSDWAPSGSRTNLLSSPIGTLALVKVNDAWTAAPDKVVRLKENSGNFHGSIWEGVINHTGAEMEKLCQVITDES
jgi:hypothetical protein